MKSMSQDTRSPSHTTKRWRQPRRDRSPAETPRAAPADAQRGLRGGLVARSRTAHDAQDWRIDPAGNRSPGYRMAKRLLDLVGALAGLVLLSPILLPVLLVLTWTTRGRPIFSQERVGYLGMRFRLYKFRTMVLDAEKVQHAVQNEQCGPVFKNRRDPRVTRLGRLLRLTSIDEMPQLVNVLRGDMSLVGPRPPIAREVAQYEPWQLARLSVKPGLTCLWQVSGRCEIDFDRWMRMDVWYVENQCLATDLLLLLRTPWAIVSGRGAY